MNSTGIVRRVDDLGRVVIPKEIRRTFKIREGDPLEIFITKEGILIKKYSPVMQISDFSKEYAESLYESTGHITLITDRDTIVSVSGGSKRDYIDSEVGKLLDDIMSSRTSRMENNSGVYDISKGIVATYSCYVIAPIVLDGDVIGSVVLMNTDSDSIMGQIEIKLAETAAGFLAKQMRQD